MVSERWSQIERLYHAARELRDSERSTFLASACAGDKSLRQEVESLLSNDQENDAFLETPALQAAAEVLKDNISTQTQVDASHTLVGQTISHYRIVAELGRGGMGVVYKAEDTVLGRPVALKFLREDLGWDRGSPIGSPHQGGVLERFKREARAASALNHPNICMVHDVGWHEGAPFMVLEYLEGQTLRQCIDAGPLPLSTVVDLATQIADALSAAHSKSIVHRDIKPTNILVTASGQAKVLDFGLAKPQPKDPLSPAAGTSLTNPGTAVGTVAYMSPEQARGGAVDARSDLFSLGTVLYEMASGHHPFPGDSGVAILHQIVADHPKPLHEWDPLMPPELERIVNKALEKDRDLRYQSAAELRSDLMRLKRDSSANRGAFANMLGSRSIRARMLRPRWALGAIAIAGALFVAGGILLRPLPPPRIIEYQQLTNDGTMKQLVATDGVRLYLNEGSGSAHWVSQMTVTGGEPARLPMSPLFRLLDVSPDGTNLLAAQVSTYGEGPVWIIPILGGSPYRLGNLEASAGAWSADGLRIAYAKRSELLIAKSDGTDTKILCKAPGSVQYPAWSPDGRRIRFTVYDEARHTSALWEVSSQGAAAHPVFSAQSAANAGFGRWTPDGRYFVFYQAGQIWALRESRGIFRPASSQPTQLTSGPIAFGGVVPSKDGKRLFAGGYAPRAETVRYDAGKRTFVSLQQGISADFLTFSKDGQWIAYITFPEGALWRSRVDGSERVQLTQRSGDAYAFLPRWSPDGTQVVYGVAIPGQLTRAYIVSSGGGKPEELPTVRGHGVTDLHWSADGQKICFGGDHTLGGPSTGPNIHIIDVQSHEITDVPGSDDFFSPRWSPDGRYLAALSLDSAHLGVFDFSTGKWRAVGTGGFFSFPCWSHDSKTLSYIQGTVNPAVMRVGVEGRAAERVVDLRDVRLTGFFGSYLSLTPDDQPLLTLDRGTQEIFALAWETH